jgi:hypothetical protein
VNALFLIPGGVGGTEIYLRELLAAMARDPRGHEFFIFLNRERSVRARLGPLPSTKQRSPRCRSLSGSSCSRTTRAAGEARHATASGTASSLR